MSTFDALVTRTLGRLTGAVGRDRTNVLATTIDADDTSVVLSWDPDALTTPGSVIQIGYEQMLVTGVTAMTLTVIRGFNGTTGVAHTSGTVIELEPRFPRQSIYLSLLDEARALPPGIFGVESVAVSFPANTNAVMLPSIGAVGRVVKAWRLDATNDVLLRPDLDLIRDPTHAVYATGYGVAIANGAVYGEPVTVRVLYTLEVDLSTASSDTDLQDESHIPVTIEDALVYLAGGTLLLDKEALRYSMQRQNQSRDAAEVPADALGQLAKRWRDEGKARISTERMRLVETYGWQM